MIFVCHDMMICIENIDSKKNKTKQNNNKNSYAKLWYKKGDQYQTLTVFASNKQDEAVWVECISLSKPKFMGILYIENHTSMPGVVKNL